MHGKCGWALSRAGECTRSGAADAGSNPGIVNFFSGGVDPGSSPGSGSRYYFCILEVVCGPGQAVNVTV